MNNMERVHPFQLDGRKMCSFWSKTHFQRPKAFALIRLAVLSLAFIFLASFPGEAASGWNWYFVDTHLHSSVSADAFVDIGIISQVAKTTGYSALFLTD